MNIPCTGPNPQKARFLREVSQAFEFLAMFHELSAEKQLEINQIVTFMKVKKYDDATSS